MTKGDYVRVVSTTKLPNWYGKPFVGRIGRIRHVDSDVTTIVYVAFEQIKQAVWFDTSDLELVSKQTYYAELAAHLMGVEP